MKKMKSKGEILPQQHFERNEGELGHESNLRYAGEFSNPSDLDKSTRELASFVKKKRMKY